MEKTNTNRLLALEGLRGVASVMVVAFHVIQAFFATSIYGKVMFQHNHLEDNLYGSPIMAFVSGGFAVAIFFVLSGFVLSVGFFSTGDKSIIKKLAAKRYFRLMIPALASVMAAWLLIVFNTAHTTDAANIIHQPGLWGMWAFQPNIWEALYDGTIGVFLNTDSALYNPALWTMSCELLGSFIIFGFLMLFGDYKNRWPIYIILIVLLANTWFLGFVLGMILADLWVNQSWIFKNNKPLGFFALAVGIFLGGYTAGDTNGTIYKSIAVQWFSLGQNQALFLTIAALLVIFAVLSIKRLQTFFGSKIVSTLGKYTFSIYLVHLPLFFSVCTGAFVWLVTDFHFGYTTSVIIAVLIYLAATAIAAYLFERYVDAPAIKLSSKFAGFILRRPSPSELSEVAVK